ncbi:hypothetical protein CHINAEXTREME_01295 [Halobiforma lacisalsi AJ5]|uniref:DUF7344 domain-containing protein n=1 Tax=Natronobacterium lacisalsi AJ5 TaxID=358396 RepID=M0LH37_NATLA|nr:hypothetical protein [Halobiforma lacisalsi]APW96482.1 hypothetical protein CHINAEXTREME_01295 [Halobiforma lacisalsi AJ5]EMA31744.1 hypothetical protein C445_13055 [Halobiforma lacisalsi AJ5]
MSSPPEPDSPTTTAFEILADARRRRLLEILLDHEADGVALSTLATEIAARERGQQIVANEQCSRVRVSLIHVHAPMLADAGVVARGSGSGERTLSRTDHPLFETPWIRTLLGGDGSLESDRLDGALKVLAPPRRRTICEVLATRRGAVPVQDLAAMVAAREGDRRLVDVSSDECSSIATDLVHADLPALGEHDLVEYDRADGTVAIATDAELWRADWVAESPLGAIPDRLGLLDARGERERRRDASGDRGRVASDDRSTPCWTIQGAENVVEHGYELADDATEELVVTVPDDGMLRGRYLERWRAAVDRGVDVYVGSRSEQVRETVRAAVPGAIVCEPRLDWLNFPTDRVGHGRLVFADRERAMLVSVADRGVDATGGPRTMAITGTGGDDPLVSLLREHLGPRLDRLAEKHCDDGMETGDEGTTPLPL